MPEAPLYRITTENGLEPGMIIQIRSSMSSQVRPTPFRIQDDGNSNHIRHTFVEEPDIVHHPALVNPTFSIPLLDGIGDNVAFTHLQQRRQGAYTRILRRKCTLQNVDQHLAVASDDGAHVDLSSTLAHQDVEHRATREHIDGIEDCNRTLEKCDIRSVRPIQKRSACKEASG